LEHEILGESFGIALDRLHQYPGFDFIERCQVGVEHGLVAAQNEDGAQSGAARIGSDRLRSR
jgi:hypothetical protein